MNQPIVRVPRKPTQAAEGIPRWRWTLDEFDRFVELGILSEEDRVELIEGELVPMAAKGRLHEDFRLALEDRIGSMLNPGQRIIAEMAWRPNDETYCEPDMFVCQRGRKRHNDLPPELVLLLIEVADTNIKYDLTTKAQLYARLGVREYWVVNAYQLETHVHLEPSSQGYAKVHVRKSGALLRPHLLPGVELRMKEISID